MIESYSLQTLTFLWPDMFWLLAVVPLLLLFYFRLMARRRLADLRYAGLVMTSADTAAQTARPLSPWRAALDHHTPAFLLILGLILLIAAVARPRAVVVLPSRVDAIIVALDASGSMRATDIKPSRLAAAQAALKTFVAGQPSQVRVGVVSIAATASLVQSPTDKRDDILRAIDRVQLQPGSALGSGLVIALTTLMPTSGIDTEKIISGKPSYPGARDWTRQTEILNFKPVAPGSNSSAAIVLVTDGESNTGPELMEAAKLAAERGVRIFTVGVGTPEGAMLSVDGWSMRVRLDEAGLKKVADMTRGEYFRAGSETDLKVIYKHLSAKLALGKGRETEITALFVAAGMLLALTAVLISLLRSSRVL